ncbi:1,3-propanediol dehydrogenase [Galdieria sulphuraria]|uniref:1,3-propanediol dehydrogenase n=1 Tax=Galdieria sulphuraria TaxID=130081 RepID=M2VVD6_GALSU|nr:1,3-propanediol dehydrogenase [Galdieria sulphuraria]EME27186.1 1,3-propanediol dehydrogenase [Galdieria sulphuraria]|eukprot:XP_005703706.1 1,3-propanediol dehydrogenase [Galdieria sulphuraria]
MESGTLVRIRQLYFYLPLSLSQRDLLTLLQEYGRRSCGEPDCIRVNIIEVKNITGNSDLLQPQLYFCIEAFRTKQAMEAHEHLSHTMELRRFIKQYCQKPETEDDSDEKETVETIVDGVSPFPFRNGWTLKKSYAPLRTPDPKDPWKQRKRALDLLAKDVGVQNITIRVTRLLPARASNIATLKRNVFKIARSHCTKDGVVRVDIIEEEKYPGGIFIIEAYESDDLTKLGYLEYEFEESLQSEVFPYCDADKKSVWKGCNVFPDLEEWKQTISPEKLPEAESKPMNVYQKMSLIFGMGALDKVSTYAKRCGSRILIITGWNQARLDPLLWELDAEMVQGNIQILPPISIPGMLSSSTFEELVQNVRIRKPDVIIGMGGGSALDAAKAVSLFAHPDNETIHSFLQQLRNAEKSELLTFEFFCEGPLLPLILVPSRPTLGAEISHSSIFGFPGIFHACLVHFVSDENNLVNSSSSSKNKTPGSIQNMISLVDARLYIRGHHVVIPTAAIASLILCLESFLCKDSNPFTIALAKEGISTVASYIEKATDDFKSTVVAEKVALTSVIAGLVREGKNFGLTGAIALALSGQSAISFRDLVIHIASITLPYYIAFIRKRGQDEIRQRLRQASKMITGSETATEDDLLIWFHQVIQLVHLPSWKDAELFNVPWKDIARIVMSEFNRVELPVEMSVEDVNSILEDLANK